MIMSLLCVLYQIVAPQYIKKRFVKQKVIYLVMVKEEKSVEIILTTHTHTYIYMCVCVDTNTQGNSINKIIFFLGVANRKHCLQLYLF